MVRVHIVFKTCLSVNRRIPRIPCFCHSRAGRRKGAVTQIRTDDTKLTRPRTHENIHPVPNTHREIKFRCEVLFGLDRPQRQNKVRLSALGPVNSFFYQKLPLRDVNQFFSPLPTLVTQRTSNQLQALKTHFPERVENTKMFDGEIPLHTSQTSAS